MSNTERDADWDKEMEKVKNSDGLEDLLLTTCHS